MSERRERIKTTLVTFFPMFIATLSLVTAIFNGASDTGISSVRTTTRR